MLEPGRLIKERRIEKNISVEAVVDALKIHKNLIIAIEQDKIESFASNAYYHGYLKQYLKFLQLNYVDFYPAQNIDERELAINIPSKEWLNPSATFTFIALGFLILIYNLCSNYISI